jgi:hypothetical protein
MEQDGIMQQSEQVPVLSLSSTHDSTEEIVLSEPQLQELLRQFEHLFQEPTALPPHKVFDHHISLIPGTQPVNVRPYRYAPQQKTKIEQVQDMLKTGLIQHSVSPFTSPVLLVKKKRWHMEIVCRLQTFECCNCKEQATLAYCG